MDDEVESTARRAAHAARGSQMHPRTVALVVGGIAALAAVGIGVTTLLDAGPRTRSSGITADRITVSRAPADFPVPRSAILALLDRPADLGVLADPDRRAACLTAAGLPGSAAVLGADTVDGGGRPAIILVLAGAAKGVMTALAVAPTCGSDDPAVLAQTVLPSAAAPRATP